MTQDTDLQLASEVASMKATLVEHGKRFDRFEDKLDQSIIYSNDIATLRANDLSRGREIAGLKRWIYALCASLIVILAALIQAHAL